MIFNYIPVLYFRIITIHQLFASNFTYFFFSKTLYYKSLRFNLKTSRNIWLLFQTEEVIVSVVVAKDPTIAGKKDEKAISSILSEFRSVNARKTRPNVTSGAQTCSNAALLCDVLLWNSQASTAIVPN